jgi:hypothetical protein
MTLLIVIPFDLAPVNRNKIIKENKITTFMVVIFYDLLFGWKRANLSTRSSLSGFCFGAILIY